MIEWLKSQLHTLIQSNSILSWNLLLVQCNLENTCMQLCQGQSTYTQNMKPIFPDYLSITNFLWKISALKYHNTAFLSKVILCTKFCSSSTDVSAAEIQPKKYLYTSLSCTITLYVILFIHFVLVKSGKKNWFNPYCILIYKKLRCKILLRLVEREKKTICKIWHRQVLNGGTCTDNICIL